MKKVLFFLFSLGAASAAFAEMPPISAGLGMGFEMQNDTQKFDLGGLATTQSENSYLLNFGIDFDATYLVAKLQYATQLGKSNVTIKTTNPAGIPDSTYDADNQLSFLELSLAGKYPIVLALGITIFPLLGLEYDLNLTANNMSAEQKTDLNDLYILAGLGVDIHVTPTVYFRPQLTYGFNTTATPTTTANGVTYSANKLDAGISVGYGL